MNKQKGIAPLIIVILISVVIGGYFLYQKQSKSLPQPISLSQSSPNQTVSDETSNINLPQKEITGICDSEVRYKTQLQVWDNKSAQKAFQAYIVYMKTNKLKDNNLAVDWFFTKAEYAGNYENAHYWVIAFSYSMKAGGDKGNAQTYVNQYGEIVDLRGCI